ncbi:MAG: hypothetical protein GX664_03475 [Bacteroidales bacterium]|nr:hypothetical protein [Bacteroidales bacterium]
MKKFLILIFALCLMTTAAQAQWQPNHIGNQQAPPNEADIQRGAERIQTAKVAYFTQQLDLSVKEAQSFWPIYNEYSKGIDEARNASRNAMMNMNSKSKSSDELKTAIKEYVASQKKEAQLTEDYVNKLSRVLPIEKVAKVFTAEDGFRMHLLNQFRMGAPDSR